MQLESKQLLLAKNNELEQLRSNWKSPPGIALIWVGDDQQTAAFVRVKQRKAKELSCVFMLHHFPTITDRQLSAVINSLNARKDIHGIVLQLPLPKNVDTDRAIMEIAPQKDIDGLRSDSRLTAPTAQGIVELLEHNNVDLRHLKTTILGDGRLVGHPLAEIFKKNGWSFTQFSTDAKRHSAEIRSHDVLISATGQNGLVGAEMVHKEMVVVDGSGVDVDIEAIESLVALITPKKGAIGPLTVCNLFENLLTSLSHEA
jgi:methylenetetrahydrofolate dehydrogenase (NADP+) / methenyltetrahydrofolate cyclohydrolase